jgi:hypothetical protein
VRKSLDFKFLPLPANFNPVDATTIEVASFRRESVWTVNKKINDGRYQSYLDGRVRKIIFASVIADRERAMMKEGAGVKLTKRAPGRPRMLAEEQPQIAAE